MITTVPLVMLAGKAGSGKDTVGAFLASTFNGVCIAQADPMKHFVQRVFAFSDAHLWGTSELRNEVTVFDPYRVVEARDAFYNAKDKWLATVLPQGHPNADRTLTAWFERIWHQYPEGFSPRVALQTLGTDWGRAIAPGMWIAHATVIARKLLGGGYRYSQTEGLSYSTTSAFDYAIIVDGRFRNEVLSVRYLGGLVLKITRPAERLDDGLQHASEAALDMMPDHFFTKKISNERGLSELFTQFSRLMYSAYRDPRGFSAGAL